MLVENYSTAINHFVNSHFSIRILQFTGFVMIRLIDMIGILPIFRTNFSGHVFARDAYGCSKYPNQLLRHMNDRCRVA